MTSEQPKLSKQRRWQLKKQAAGLCQKCGKPAFSGGIHCLEHGIDSRERTLAYLRSKRGIAIDRPLKPCGRKRLYA